MRKFWFGMTVESGWTVGSPWKIESESGELYDDGEIVESDPPRRLVIRWQHQKHAEMKAEGPSLCTMEIEPGEGAVKLTITHTLAREGSKFIDAVSGGWPQIISNLKSLLETGESATKERHPSK